MALPYLDTEPAPVMPLAPATEAELAQAARDDAAREALAVVGDLYDLFDRHDGDTAAPVEQIAEITAALREALDAARAILPPPRVLKALPTGGHILVPAEAM